MMSEFGSFADPNGDPEELAECKRKLGDVMKMMKSTGTFVGIQVRVGNRSNSPATTTRCVPNRQSNRQTQSPVQSPV